MITPSHLTSHLYRAAAKTPMIASAAEEMALIVRAQAGDQQASHTLVQAYLRLILSMARQFSAHADLNDLVAEGVVGFMRAIEGFDIETGNRLGTYARPWVRERLRDHARKVRSVVGIGATSERRRGLYHLAPAMEREARAARERGEHATYHQLLERAAADVGISITNAQDLMARSGGDMSLNAPTGGEEGDTLQWQDVLIDDRADPEAQLHASKATHQRTAIIQQAMIGLNARERRIITERRLSDNPTTLEALGIEFDISKERVRQIEKRAFEKMEAAIHSRREEALTLI